MLASQPAISRPAIAARRPGRAWLVWIGVSVIGGTLGALAAWQLRSLLQTAPDVVQRDLAYAATFLSVLIASGLQWVFWRRYRLDAYWWVPATVAANLTTVAIVIPAVFNLFDAPSNGTTPTMTMAVIAGASALAVSGLIVGSVQGFVLHTSAGTIAWLWIPATVVGGALAGALTTALASQLLGLPALATISAVAAAGALLTSACQAPIVPRIIR